MLDPRIYRTGLMAVVVAVIVVAFSLENQQGAVGTTLPPEAFNGQTAYADMHGLAKRFPSLEAGSPADNRLAGEVATALRQDGLVVSTSHASTRTVLGSRTLQTVIGTMPGQSAGGSIVVVAHRDASGRTTEADVSGTAVLLELAQVLGGETQQRSVVLASTSGSAGAAGATQLARRLGTPVDAVIALGDVTSAGVRQPVVVPWSDSQLVAPPLLRNTLAAALGAQAGLRAGSPGLVAQFSHLAFPLAVTEQGPFGRIGDPAVLLSMSSERAPAGGQPASPGRLAALGRTVQQTIDALEASAPVPAPSTYLIWDSKVIPAWAVKLLVLALILPVLLTMVDGLARARRRGNPILRWLLWVLAGAVPFVLAVLVVIAARVIGVLAAPPPGPLGAGQMPLGGAGTTVIVLSGVVIVGLLLARRPLVSAITRAPLGKPANAGAGAAVLLVMCLVALAIWIRNPFAAALLVPALHAWMWVLDPDTRIPRPAVALLVLVGIAPPVIVILYYSQSLGLSPIQIVWNGVLLIAGGYIGLLAAVQWSLVLGCLVSVISIAARRPRLHRSHPEQTPVTVRGPATYAGPGSLGGTESALRR
jgi:Peptidase family M28